MYPPELTAPMAAELVASGFEELKTPDQVDKALAQPGDGAGAALVDAVPGRPARCRPPSPPW